MKRNPPLVEVGASYCVLGFFLNSFHSATKFSAERECRHCCIKPYEFVQLSLHLRFVTAVFLRIISIIIIIIIICMYVLRNNFKRHNAGDIFVSYLLIMNAIYLLT